MMGLINMEASTRKIIVGCDGIALQQLCRCSTLTSSTVATLLNIDGYRWRVEREEKLVWEERGKRDKLKIKKGEMIRVFN